MRLYDPLPAQDDFKVDERGRRRTSSTTSTSTATRSATRTSKPTLVVGARARPGAPARQLVDEPAPRVHARLRRGRGRGRTRSTSTSRATCCQNIPPHGRASSSIRSRAGVLRRDAERLRGRRHQGRRARGDDAARRAPTTKYTGNAGVPVSSFLRKAALALRFGDWNLFVSGQVTSSSRVIYIRDVVRARARRPRRSSSSTPTRTRSWSTGASRGCSTRTRRPGNYPYSQSIHPQEPAGSGLDTDFNYVRNSVKATVDAYDGTVKFYVVDPTDPIIQTYRKAFPELFTDVEQAARRACASTSGTPKTSSARRPSSTRCTTSPIRCSTSTSRTSGTSPRLPTRPTTRRRDHCRAAAGGTTAAATRRCRRRAVRPIRCI